MSDADGRARTVSRLLDEAGQRPHRAETLLPVLYDDSRALARAHVAREALGMAGGQGRSGRLARPVAWGLGSDRGASRGRSRRPRRTIS